MNSRKLCIVTGTRADYGHLYWLMKDILADTDLTLQVVVTGMHLAPEFGKTENNLLEDGFPIHERVDLKMTGDTPVDICRSMGLAVIGCGEAFQRLQPDLVLIYGDRFEMLAAAQAAIVCRLPIAHIAGGETSEGAMDEMFRHAITKMSTYHFVTAEPHRERVIQLGEDPARVWNVGEPGLDHLTRSTFLSRRELEQSLSLAFGPQNFLVTYHAATRGDEVPAHAFAEILEALEAFPQSHVVFTGSNADTNGRIIGSLIEDWVRRFPSRAHFFHNLGYRRYVSLMRQVDAVIGNSSSGLIEAPAVGVPTVNVGDRQKGRLRAPSVIDCIPRAENVKDAIRRALIPEFRDAARTQPHPFGNGTASARILQTLKQQSLEVGAPKSFFAIPLTKDL